MDQKSFIERFGKIPVIGMIHLAGDSHESKVKNALTEIEIYQEEGVNGAIIENYHGEIDDVARTLSELNAGPDFHIGINILPNEYNKAFFLANVHRASFIQLDHVAGTYTNGTMNDSSTHYSQERMMHKKIAVFGGVWPKYYTPMQGSRLDDDLRAGMRRADAIVVTGPGTGQETPIDKIKKFRETIGEDYPIIIGAGLNASNAYDQLLLADGAICGSSFKPGRNTQKTADRHMVRDIMDIVNDARKEKHL